MLQQIGEDRKFRRPEFIGDTLPSLAEACTELNTLPSLAEATSLKEFELAHCNKLEKIEGLDGLKWLVLVANDRSVIEPSISNIQKWQREASASIVQKWQREVMVCTRAVIDVDSLKNFCTPSSPENVAEYGSSGGLTLTMPESAANAILICFVIDYVHPNLGFHISTDKDNHFYTKMSNGKWLWMGIFPQGSDWAQSKRYQIQAFCEDKEVKVKEAWSLMGKEGSVLEAFHQLSQRKDELDACEKTSDQSKRNLEDDDLEVIGC